METLFTTTFHPKESWRGNRNKFHQLFTLVTGYYILFEESREDLLPENNTADYGMTRQIASE
jgi:hypothetical protein